MVSQIKVNEIIKQSGSSITIGESGDTVSIPSGCTIANSGTATESPSRHCSNGCAPFDCEPMESEGFHPILALMYVYTVSYHSNHRDYYTSKT